MVVLPAPLGPTSADDLARPRRERDVVAAPSVASAGSAVLAASLARQPLRRGRAATRPRETCPTSRSRHRSSATRAQRITARADAASPVAERDVLEADLAAHRRPARRAPGRSSISSGRSSTSKTRSKLTIEVTSSTRALVSAASGPYNWVRYAPNATTVPIVKASVSTR